MTVEFRTLGAIEFRGLETAAARALEAQPKRLAVLGYLLLAGRDGGLARASIASVFWPDRPGPRARGSLRNAIHHLRRHLGADAIRSRGDRLAVDPSLLRCDALAVLGLLAEDRAQEALVAYGGDLLPGLGTAGSPAFARWLEGERSALRRAVADAAWSLVEREEERRNWISAADHARRAVALSGGGERDVRRLMRLFERAGDGVAALEVYDWFAERWRGELRVEPSGETRALAEAIRHRSSALPESSPAAVDPPNAASRPHASVEPPRAREGADAVAPPWAREPSRKLAILPFLRTGSKPEDEYLASGLTHAMITALSRLSSIRVVARTSVERYRAGRAVRGLRPIAEALGADAVLQGSLGLSGGRLAVAAQLVDARSGAPLWAEVYERDPSELLTIQSELVLAILEVLGSPLSTTEQERLATRPTRSAEAYRLYLEGRMRLGHRSPREVEAAIERFQAALRIDPDFALALAGLADAYFLSWTTSGVRRPEARIRCREAARAALRADPGLGEVHATLGMLRGGMDGDWYGAEADFRRAIELSPGHAAAHHWYGAYLSFVLRRPEDASAELALARELDPLSAIIHNDTGVALLNEGRPAEAIVRFREALELDPAFWRGHHDLGIALALEGDLEGGADHLARAWCAGAYGIEPDPPPPPSVEPAGGREVLEARLARLDGDGPGRGWRGLEGALVSMLLGRPHDALRWLEVSRDEGSWASIMMYLPVFEPLRGNPAFSRLLDEVGLRSPWA